MSSDIILQGPHFAVFQPFSKEPNRDCKNNLDWATIDLLDLADGFIPRTNYQRVIDKTIYESRIPHWGGSPSTAFWRLAWRAMTNSGLERSLISAIIAPGPAHINSVFSMRLEYNRLTALLAGLFSSLSYDYLAKVSGVANLHTAALRRFPIVLEHSGASQLLLRVLRLNCLTRDYAPLWDELYEASFAEDLWTSSFKEWPVLAVPHQEWTMDTPLRTDFERRAALVEIDALVAIMLGLTADQLDLMYTGQFGVLRKYEYTMWFDNEGTKIAKETHAKGVRQQDDDYKLLMAHLDGQDSGDLLTRYMEPFVKIDREAEMRAAHAEFTARLGL